MTVMPPTLAEALHDRYRIVRELGRGGMATVYLASELKHDRQVAIKVLRPELAAVLGTERFLAEIKITAALDHPHILTLIDSGSAAGFLYYVLPLVRGESLGDKLHREKQLALDEALTITKQIAGALDHAHRQGVIHRDIKPDNILLQDGEALLTDFGIALAIQEAGGTRLTETGMAIGTQLYMSPEQSMAERTLDGRTDQYALACVLYEMLAGEPPYTGPTAQAIIAKRMTQPVPSVRTLRETVPESVDRALLSALAKSPADRFATVGAFAGALTDPARFPVPARVPGPNARRRQWILPVAMVLALTAVAGLLAAHSRRPPVPPSASVIAVLPLGSNGVDTALARLGRDLVLTISASLDGVGGIRTADPHGVLSTADESRSGQWLPNAIAEGKRLGAGSVIVGGIVKVGSDVRLDLKLMSTSGDSEPLARVSVLNSPDSIGALTDSITWAVLRQVWRRGEPPSPRLGSITTHSVLALRAFLDGERLSVANRYAEAADAYAAAIKADSTFWLAGWQFNEAQGWVSDGEADTVLERGYESHRSAFGERDRLLIEAEMTSDSLPDSAHLARFRAITERFPSDWPAWFHYADHLFHQGGMIGHTNAETRAALQRTVDLNPRLVSMWKHLFQASVGHDSAQSGRALQALMGLAAWSSESEDSRNVGFDAGLFWRVLQSANGQVSLPLLDSLISAIIGRKWPGPPGFLASNGFPAAQIEFNRRWMRAVPAGTPVGRAWRGIAYAWVARGAWDSVLVAWDRYASASPDQASGVDIYALAVVGGWLGGLDTARATERRAAAVRYLSRLSPEDSLRAREARGTLAWADGMVAVIRRDARALEAARVAARQSGAEGAVFLDRSLAAFEHALKGEVRLAADSLAALDLAATESELFQPRDPSLRSIDHLAASRWLLELGDTTRAVRLLAWHEANPGDDAATYARFAPLAYFELARIEQAQGRADLAIEHYQQFLRRYDMPTPAHRHLVDEAKVALRHLTGQNDPPGPQ